MSKQQKEKRKTIAPRNSKTLKEVCSMPSDNYGGRTHWILANHQTVTIAQWKKGQTNTNMVTLKKKQFNELIDWYLREQKLKPVTP